MLWARTLHAHRPRGVKAYRPSPRHVAVSSRRRPLVRPIGHSVFCFRAVSHGTHAQSASSTAASRTIEHDDATALVREVLSGLRGSAVFSRRLPSIRVS